MKTKSPTMPKMLCAAGFIFEDLGLVFFIVKRRHAREDSRSHGSQTGWKDLSLFPQSSRRTVQSCCRTLRILKVLTLSNQLQDTDVMGLFKSICSQSQSSQNIFQTHLWCPHFFSMELSAALLDTDVSAFVRVCVCVWESTCACVCTCSD